ncbi:MAG TPA: bifunctional phosphoribosylaminoimidazolecarboxamide formyltransferase/inosine monophosphate cyclohydrolase [Ktedonobacterales bacterium]|nr:bifunctional phosphoribosylaminoimidazolecarboxamide formyltransferase/inosine monophosphate cyclohydrolase [Ktedonobacterales bacterium]
MRALISVSDKDGLADLAHGLLAHGVEIISTGGTASALRAADVPVTGIEQVTGFPEILGGRVKTLHPAVHGGILARRDDAAHMAELQQLGITPIDIVVCNLYRFAEMVVQPGAALAEVLEEIDIGGVTLLRAAAKNFPHVTVVVRPRDYLLVLSELAEHGAVTAETRRWLAALAFQHTAVYDSLIAAYLRKGTPEAVFPEEVTLALHRLQTLRYGENPHQQAALYTWGVAQGNALGPVASGSHPAPPGNSGSRLARDLSQGYPPPTIAGATVLHGKELGFNNILDLDAALAAVASFLPPTAVIIKHTNPCGLACGDSLVEAYKRAHAGDPVSAYGGIIGFNREVDEATAAELTTLFYEAIIAPGYSEAALERLRQRKNLRLLATGTPIGPAAVANNKGDLHWLDLRRVSGGLLLQTADVVSEQDAQPTVMTEREPTLDEVTDLLFAWKAVQHVKSNAIVLAKKLMLVGAGAGQTNRVFSVEIAVQKAGDRARGSVLASDAYFPFPDGVEAACKAGVTAIIQPGGSIRDAEAIKMANHYGVAMLMTGQRHFRH